MKELNIYLESGIRGPHRRDGVVGYIIEWPTEKGPATLTGFEKVEDVSENRATLCGLTAALARIKEKCILNIFTSSNYLYRGFEIEQRVEKWRANGWKTAQGKEVKNKDKWLEVLNLANGSLCSYRLNEKHEYSDWLVRETNKRQAAVQQGKEKKDV